MLSRSLSANLSGEERFFSGQDFSFDDLYAKGLYLANGGPETI